jgi:hypothetical protein
MDPLANTDLQTYIKNLVDHHLPDKADREKDSATRRKTLNKRSDDKVSPKGKAKGKLVKEA